MGDFLASKGSPFQNLFKFTLAGVKCRVVALKVSSYIIVVQVIFSGPLGSMSSFPVVPNIQIRLKIC